MQAEDRIEQRRQDRGRLANYEPDALMESFRQDQEDYNAVRRHNKRYTAGGLTVRSRDLREYYDE